MRVTNELHEEFYQRYNDLMRQSPFDKLSPIELVAILSNHLGKLVALQDQRLYTPEQVMKVVTDNFEAGNEQIIASLTTTKGNA